VADGGGGDSGDPSDDEVDDASDAEEDSNFLHDPSRQQHNIMDLFRSQDMRYVSITMTNDSAHATVRELGHAGCVHVVDLAAAESAGAAPSRELLHYKKRLADCQYWERKLCSS
jgi:hypothetical protein